MNIKGRLEHLAHLSMRDRQTGRSTMFAKVAEETGGIVITHNHEHAKYIEKNFKVPARSMEINLEGFSGPFILDHHATEVMFLKAANKIESLENEVKALRNILKQISNLSNFPDTAKKWED